jgi:putative ABC transport system substrate-binding protein
MKRRRLLSGFGAGILLAPFGAIAQQPKKIPRIGYLSTAAPATDAIWLAAFEQGLRDLGYIEGTNLLIERRHASGQAQRLTELAAELARLKVDVIVTYGGIDAAKKASSTIPIVMTVHADPVRAGIVASLARPGGQVTGLSDLHAGLAPKRVEFLKEVVPGMNRVAVLHNPAATIPGPGQLPDLHAAASALRVSILPMEVKALEDIDRVFALMKKEGVGGITIIGEPTVLGLHRQRIVELAIRNGIPAIGTVRAWAEAGLLMSYGTEFRDLWRRAATYTDKILKGAKPAELPVEQPTRFEFVINMKTAGILGVTIPQSLQLRADQLIQ